MLSAPPVRTLCSISNVDPPPPIGTFISSAQRSPRRIPKSCIFAFATSLSVMSMVLERCLFFGRAVQCSHPLVHPPAPERYADRLPEEVEGLFYRLRILQCHLSLFGICSNRFLMPRPDTRRTTTGSERSSKIRATNSWASSRAPRPPLRSMKYTRFVLPTPPLS